MKLSKLRKARLVAIASVLLGTLFTAIGCGSSYAKVTGLVSYKGEPLPSGKINFIGRNGTQLGTGDIRADGGYTVYAAPIGDCVVTIVTEPQTPDDEGVLQIAKGAAGRLKDAPKEGVEIHEEFIAIRAEDEKKDLARFGTASPYAKKYIKVVQAPSRYRGSNTSPLKFAIKEGTNVI